MQKIKIKLYNQIMNEILEKNLNIIDARVTLSNILDKYHVQIIEDDPNKYEIKINIERFLKDKSRQGISKNTISNYKLQLNLFAKFITKKVQEITTKDVLEFLDAREEQKKINKSTLETVRSILKTFFEWMEAEQIIYVNPMLKIKPYKIGKLIAKALTVEELEFVRESCITPRERALVEVLYSTGCRLEELTNLTIKDIDWQNRTIRVLGKGNKERIVFFSARAAIYLNKYLSLRTDSCKALFVTERRPFRKMSKRAVQKDVSKLGVRANLSKVLSPNVFRHTMATLMLNKGCPISVVQELLGHDDLNTTKTYAKVTYEHKHQSYERFFHQ